jgi:hypothetical protein
MVINRNSHFTHRDIYNRQPIDIWIIVENCTTK